VSHAGAVVLDPSDKIAANENISIRDFYAFMPTHSYIFVPTRELWPASSVNARLPPIGPNANGQQSGQHSDKSITPASWLDRNRPVEQMTWVPGEPMLIRDRLIADGGWVEHTGVTCFNLYRPPTSVPVTQPRPGPGNATSERFSVRTPITS
jgi:hypothetical protein